MNNNSNCITCLDEKKFINLGNCVSECKNGYYNNTNETLGLSIKTCKCDLENCFACSLESLSNNNSCISCNIEKGYYSIYNDINNNYIKCYKSPKGFYLDLNDLLYKKCYISCKESNLSGNEYYHNCIECNDNYIYEIQLEKYKICYINCSFYYYFDDTKNKFYCTQKLQCEGIYNKLIIGSRQCIDECDKISKYKFRDECYSECPEATIKSLEKPFYCDIICNEDCPFELINKQICVNNCTLSLIKNKLCIIKYDSNNYFEVNNSNIDNNEREKEEIKAQDKILTNIEKGFTSEDYNTSDLDNGQDEVIETKKMKVILSTLENQKQREKEKNNLTSIYLGDCENKLREYYKISKYKILYLKKIEIPMEGIKILKIKYDIYCKLYDTNLIRLNLSICENTKIDIILPVILNEDVDKLNSSSDYYNDICYTTTSESGTDISLKDRKKEFI